jgi:hypothetical protein
MRKARVFSGNPASKVVDFAKSPVRQSEKTSAIFTNRLGLGVP